MPELPDVTVYVEALEQRILGETLVRSRITNVFVLRTAAPAPEEAAGRAVRGIRRIGKRIVITFDGELFLVIHLMIAGRLHWKALPKPGAAPAKVPAKIGLAAFDFSSGTLLFTEAGSKRRASLHMIQGETELAKLDPGGLEVLTASEAEFASRLTSENHTLKRSLANPHLFSGIGNAYSDEILHRARLSPVALTSRLTQDEVSRLYATTRGVLTEWTDLLRRAAGKNFPEHVTAFREGMAVHGRFGAPCPVCGSPVQRIRYAENETNYCARCQTEGRVLADRSLSRLLKDDWPRDISAWE